MTGPEGRQPAASKSALEERAAFTPRFGEGGLIPCVSIDASTGAVLMLAWMNAEALEATLSTKVAHYWSRSRGRLWKKGETSSALQHVVEMRTDCDQDTLLLRVRVERPEHTCHTGRATCFYRSVDPDTTDGVRGLSFVG